MRDKEKWKRFSSFFARRAAKRRTPQAPSLLFWGWIYFFSSSCKPHDVVHRQGEEHALAVGLQAGLPVDGLHHIKIT